MAIGRCKSANVVHSRGGYQEPTAVTAPILDHRYGHYLGSNRVTKSLKEKPACDGKGNYAYF
jgi:hypothetical protein